MRIIARVIDSQIKDLRNKPKTQQKNINFIKEGKKPLQTKTEHPCYLDSAKDWQIRSDLAGNLKIPDFILPTNMRPDIILISEWTKQMALVELTVPREDRIDISSELKRTKYQEIVTEAGRRKWTVKVWTVEVGCRGFPAASVGKLLKDMGIKGRKKMNILKEVGEEAERSSNVLWKCYRVLKWGQKKE